MKWPSRAQAFASRLGIRHPIFQAPMAGATSPESVAAACESGILGNHGVGQMTAQRILADGARIRSLTDKPFGLNVFALHIPDVSSAEMMIEVENAQEQLAGHFADLGVEQPQYAAKQPDTLDNQLQAVLEVRPAVLSFTFGRLDEQWMTRFKEAGIYVIGTATCVEEAKILQADGCDAVVAQGGEAGGHRGSFLRASGSGFTGPPALIGTMALLPQVCDAVGPAYPVIAAGGIGDGRGVAAAIGCLGAHGAALGTAFLTAAECPTSSHVRQAVREARDADSIVTKKFSGKWARGLQNSFTEAWDDTDTCRYPVQQHLTNPIRLAATNYQDYRSKAAIWCGQMPSARQDLPTLAIVDEILSQVEHLCK